MKFKDIVESKQSYSTFKTHNDNDLIDGNGTHRLGTIQTSYAHIVDVFGKPITFKGDDGDGVRAEWDIEFETNDSEYIIATIYDWHNDEPIEEVKEWHIGGKEYAAVELLDEALGL